MSRPPHTPARSSTCRACGRAIDWQLTLTRKWTPVNLDGTSHFASCPAAAEFRKRKGASPR